MHCIIRFTSIYQLQLGIKSKLQTSLIKNEQKISWKNLQSIDEQKECTGDSHEKEWVYGGPGGTKHADNGINCLQVPNLQWKVYNSFFYESEQSMHIVVKYNQCSTYLFIHSMWYERSDLSHVPLPYFNSTYVINGTINQSTNKHFSSTISRTSASNVTRYRNMLLVNSHIKRTVCRFN